MATILLLQLLLLQLPVVPLLLVLLLLLLLLPGSELSLAYSSFYSNMEMCMGPKDLLSCRIGGIRLHSVCPSIRSMEPLLLCNFCMKCILFDCLCILMVFMWNECKSVLHSMWTECGACSHKYVYTNTNTHPHPVCNATNNSIDFLSMSKGMFSVRGDFVGITASQLLNG